MKWRRFLGSSATALATITTAATFRELVGLLCFVDTEQAIS